jgi:hypothetical protein
MGGQRRDEIRRAVYLAAGTYCVFPILLLGYVWKEPVTAPGFLLGPLAMLYLVWTGRWDLTGYALRLVFPILLLILVDYRAGWLATALIAVSFAISPLLDRLGKAEVIDLNFPLRGGIYYVAHGGASSMLNRHHGSESQRFALDIVALNGWGVRARGIYPSTLAAYEIFGRSLYSPCAGIVTAIVDDLPDEEPSRAKPAGNHVIIRRNGGDIYVGLAHLRQGSVAVRPGDRVEAGQRIGEVGNSGNSSEPHLHIHAKRGGDAGSMLDGHGVRMRFGGRWLVRNSLVRARG